MKTSTVVLVLLLLSSCAPIPAPPGDATDADVEIALHPWFRDLRTVQATLGTDTLTLLFDTGGGATLITPAVAARIGCRPHGRDVGHRMDGERVEFQRCDSLALGLSGRTHHFRPVAVFDVNALLPAELPRLDGVLALDAFNGEVLTLDWPGQRVIVRAAGRREAALAVDGIPTRTATGEHGGTRTLFARVTGPRGPLWFLLDSGNLAGTLIDRHLLRDSLLVLHPDSTLTLQVGPRRPIRVRPVVGDLILDGALGTEFLQGGPVSLDLRRPAP